ncbi:MAG: hypothetical protein JXL67_11760, partial [Calditrichaeota bacterium]|nr:hypothetical protein [Calditrichota bacterium]
LFNIISAVIFLLLAVSCRKLEIPDDGFIPTIPEETLARNTWIKDNMDIYYYWNDKIPADVDYRTETDSKVLFEKLLYREKDKWSTITEEFVPLNDELNGIPITMGYYPVFYRTSPLSDNVIAVVAYVYPQSIAHEVGLERGDIILSINEIELDTVNYYSLYSGDSYSVQLGMITENNFEFTGESLNMTARRTYTDPSIYHEIFDIEGYKIGYFVYSEFISGEQGEYLLTMDNIFNKFKAANISELIIDLRYNPGGNIYAAVHLASQIAPSAAILNEMTIIDLQYNNGLQAYLEYYGYTNYLHYNFDAISSNVNMQRVYILTTSRSASASELLITGLEPYMDVVQIGDTTYGKYAGSWVIPDDSSKWAMMPIVTKYSNSEGFTDFEEGLAPDHEIEDDLFSAVPFGDTSDPLVAKAIELATGSSVTPKSSKGELWEKYIQLSPGKMNRRKNLLILPGLDQMRK